MSLTKIRKEIKSNSNSKKAKVLQGFFKTGKGEYGEGDIFLGLTVPQSRELAEKYSSLSLQDTQSLLESRYHEERLIALLILVDNFEKQSDKRQDIFNFYINNTSHINNWDLVDLSAPNIFGRFIFSNGKSNLLLGKKLFDFAHSNNLWEKRIAIVSTYYFIKNNRFDETLQISKSLMADKHDLIHKACGWMLREVGKKDLRVLEFFLAKHYKSMPRTMLRYAIEKFPENKRKAYLHGEI